MKFAQFIEKNIAPGGVSVFVLPLKSVIYFTFIHDPSYTNTGLNGVEAIGETKMLLLRSSDALIDNIALPFLLFLTVLHF